VWQTGTVANKTCCLHLQDTYLPNNIELQSRRQLSPHNTKH